MLPKSSWICLDSFCVRSRGLLEAGVSAKDLGNGNGRNKPLQGSVVKKEK